MTPLSLDREGIHTALDALLDAVLALFEQARRAPPADELVALRDLPFEKGARINMVRNGQLRVVRIGRKLFTTRAAVAALFESLPAGHLSGPKSVATHARADLEWHDDLMEAVAKRVARRAREKKT